MLFNLILGAFTLIITIVAIGKYRYENGLSRYSKAKQ